MSKTPDAGQMERLRRLAALPDEQIDTSDLPVIGDWSEGVRGGTPRDVRRKMARAAPQSDATVAISKDVDANHRRQDRDKDVASTPSA
jgi:hypothetical protein